MWVEGLGSWVSVGGRVFVAVECERGGGVWALWSIGMVVVGWVCVVEGRGREGWEGVCSAVG